VNATVPEEVLLGVVELLIFVAGLCADQHDPLNAAIYRFTTSSSYAAAELGADAADAADYLARALGFADASMEPAR